MKKLKIIAALTFATAISTIGNSQSLKELIAMKTWYSYQDLNRSDTINLEQRTDWQVGYLYFMHDSTVREYRKRPHTLGICDPWGSFFLDIIGTWETSNEHTITLFLSSNNTKLDCTVEAISTGKLKLVVTKRTPNYSGTR